MFWSVVLPAKITLCIIAVVVLLVTALAPKVKWKRGKTFGISILLGAVAFIPSCSGVMSLLDPYRFGVFQYETASEISDVHVNRWLPADAKSITVEHQSVGFRASYTISQNELDDHFDDQWKRYEKHSVSKRSESQPGQTVSAATLEREFGGLKWQFFDDTIEYKGPIASNGAGYSIWYSPSQAIAYQSAGYW